MSLNRLFFRDKNTNQIINNINNKKNIKISGLNDARLSFFTGNIIHKLKKNVLFITYDSYRIDQIYEDLLRLVPEDKILTFPAIEVLPHEQILPDFLILKSRLEVLQELIFNNQPRIILTTATALMRKLMPANLFEKYSNSLHIGQEIDYKKISSRINLLGYQRVDMVEEPQEYSIRGGIFDIFPLTADRPYRIELFGDEIDSIRMFDPGSQRSFEEIKSIVIPPASEIILFPGNIKNRLPVIKNDFEKAIRRLKKIDHREEAEDLKQKSEEVLEKLQELNQFPGYEQFLPYFYNNLNNLFNYLGQDGILFFDHFNRAYQRLQHYYREIQETLTTLLEQGNIIPSYNENFMEPAFFLEVIKNYPGIYFSEDFQEIPLDLNFEKYGFNTRGVEPFHGQLELLATRLQELLDENYRVVITLNSETKAKRIARYLQDQNLPAVHVKQEISGEKIAVTSGSFSEGFIINDIKLAVFTEKEVIGNPQRKKRKMTDIEEGVKISSLNELSPGDYVVHENHGIGRYIGVKTMEVTNQHKDYLVLQYAGEDKLYVPTEQVNLVQKYIGADTTPPKLYKLGGSKWKKVKQKVQNSVREMAIELLDLYAERETVLGYSFSEDTVWQREFEDTFPYEETPDQIQAIAEVKQDMESSTPMDRLLCGDVGYGKTEVAIRAAFKAAVDGKQTAVLVPTTILAQQHYNTFTERIEDYPINIDMISRFRTPKEQREILKKVATGEIDIVIGTHRLLSKDVIFNDLGLLIVDEEQRFGVSHKERLKDMKRNVDVLTLTATPIPRTLHMALAGVRDMSVIETPPENRYPIRTYIREFNEELVRESVRRELGREGQIYFVHNRVEDIEEKADMIRKLVPEASVVIAHGQMNENRLEEIMYNFYNHHYDVLVCTTIIENGLDISNVNTIIINRAERMGLAQLYQLRGRVGRSNRIAYAYLLYKENKILSEIAEKRLRAIKEFTNLGSGFKIAMRDLEIRGAGNLLGPEQHGHIATIGFSLYCKLLENAVEELKGKKKQKEEIKINIEKDAYIPDEYISDSKQKVEVYKKIRKVNSEQEISDVIDELVDRFGDPPTEVVNLIDIAKITVKARKLGIEKITQKDKIIECQFKNADKVAGNSIVKLTEEYKIKIRSGNKPVIGIKVADSKQLKLLKEVLDSMLDLNVSCMSSAL